MNRHLTNKELQEYAESPMRPDRRSDVELHMIGCEECRARLRFVKEFETALRHVPLEEPTVNFTERVMQRIGISELPSFAWIVFRNLAPLCALTVVGGILFFILERTGAIQSSQVQQSIDAGRSISDSIGGTVSGGVGAMTVWMQKYLSFAFARNVYTLTTFLLAFFGAIGLLDRFIFSPMMKRKA